MNTQRNISTGSGCRGRGVCGHDKPSISGQTWPQTPRPRHLCGFTLVELLVVIAIIVLLVGMLLPALNRFLAAGEKAKVQASINLIDGACRYYFNDFDDYPPSNDSNYLGWTGSELIVLFLTGYGPDAGGDLPSADLSADDGVEGYGFRLVQRGDVHGPYNGVEELKVRSGGGHPEFVDTFDNPGRPILYYRWTGSDYNDSHNSDGPGGGINNYAQTASGTYYRTDFILINKGLDEDWNAPRDGDSDDVTNFFNR